MIPKKAGSPFDREFLDYKFFGQFTYECADLRRIPYGTASNRYASHVPFDG